MIQILTTEESRNVDKISINGDINIGYDLMRQAAEGLAGEVIKSIKGDIRKKVAIVCGKGNNGGDGFLSGALLIRNGYLADCFFLYNENDLNGEAHLAYEEYKKIGQIYNIKNRSELKTLKEYHIIVDAMLGTGVKGSPRGFIAETIKDINSINKKVIAVDAPSGMNCDTGDTNFPCIKAIKTVTMGFPKIGQYFYPSKEILGKLEVIPLNYDLKIVKENTEPKYLVQEKDIKKLIPKRTTDGSKYDHGVVGVIAGSKGMTGAAALSMMAALRSGCGMVYGYVPQNIISTLSVKVTEPVLIEIKVNCDGSLSSDSYEKISQSFNKIDTLLIGPGLSQSEDTKKLIRNIVKNTELPLVLDADGLNAFIDNVDLLKEIKGQVIITPHKGEFERLFGKVSKNPILRVKYISNIAKKFNIIIVFKGNPTIISTGNEVYIVDSGNSALATAGTGDVLAGIITSLISQGATVVDAACAGVYIHGVAGCLAAEERSEYSVVATDVCETIGKTFKKVLSVE